MSIQKSIWFRYNVDQRNMKSFGAQIHIQVFSVAKAAILFSYQIYAQPAVLGSIVISVACIGQ